MKKFSKPLGLLSITLCALFIASSSYAIDPIPVAPTVGDGADYATAYEIASVGNLYWVTQNSTEWDKYYTVTADIDLSDSLTWDLDDAEEPLPRGFSPIGTPTDPFTGWFDGGTFAITGLFVDRTGTPTGLFGTVGELGEIININLVDVAITGDTSVGGLAGEMNGTLTNCIVTGAVTGTASHTGGIAGQGSGTIIKAEMSGTVTGGTYVGGILGYSTDAVLQECHSDAYVFASGEQTGGLVGGGVASVTISDSYVTNSVSATSHVGGLIGYSADAIVTNSYSTAAVTDTTYAGGLIGQATSATVTGSFWDTETSGQATSDGGMGKTSAEMSTLATFTDASWDFTSIWSMVDSGPPPTFHPWELVVVPGPDPDPDPEPDPDPTPDLVDDITAFESDSSGGCFIRALN